VRSLPSRLTLTSAQVADFFFFITELADLVGQRLRLQPSRAER
jgi:hypothetical protein